MSKLAARPYLLIIPLIFFLITLHISSSRRLNKVDAFVPLYVEEYSSNVTYLRELNLSPTIKYGRIEIHVQYDDAVSHDEQLDISLPPFRQISLDEITADLSVIEHSPPLKLKFQRPPKHPDFSTVIFGVATTLDRLEESMGQFSHWISNTNATMLAFLEPAPADGIARVVQRARALGFHLHVEQADEKWETRHYVLSKLVWEKRIVGLTEWYVMIDDDTFFLNSNALKDMLSAHDASKPHYIGGVTEDFGQVKNFGFQAYGGGGIMLSMPLLEELNANFDECFAQKTGGDIMLANCIYEHKSTRFTMEHRLHQFDVNGDLSGIYEAGAARPQMLSVHHWKSWHELDPVPLAAVSAITGDDSLLQRWKFTDGWWLTNGYSLVKYSEDVPVKKLAIEHTWRENGDYRHSFDPLRPKDENKISLRLVKVVVTRSSVTQIYVRRKEDGDEVFEVIWRR